MWATPEEESWSGGHQVKEQALKINQGDWKKPKRRAKREELEVREDFPKKTQPLCQDVPLILMRRS